MLQNIEILTIRPAIRSSLNVELSECFNFLDNYLNDNKLEKKSVLKITFFVDAADNIRYSACNLEILLFVNEYFVGEYPAVSIIPQPPAYSNIAAEVYILKDSNSIKIESKKLSLINYKILEYDGNKLLFTGGLAQFSDEAYKNYYYAFSLMKNILDTEGFEFSNVVRQWNYIEGITNTKEVGSVCRQHYQLFNDVRSDFYGASQFINGYPAATGIGMNCGGVLIDFIAVKGEYFKILPIKNKMQTNAHEYSEKVLVGNTIEQANIKTTPKFERAKAVIGDTPPNPLFLEGELKTTVDIVSGITKDYQNSGGIIFISGTASIRGEKSVANGDVEEQTKITLENIKELITKENLCEIGIENYSEIKLLNMRCYVKNPEDFKIVETVCYEFFPEASLILVHSDVCRPELLVEIEAAAIII